MIRTEMQRRNRTERYKELRKYGVPSIIARQVRDYNDIQYRNYLFPIEQLGSYAEYVSVIS